MGTNSLEANLILQLTEMINKVLNEILLGIYKAYDALDHGFCLYILVT